MGVIFRGFGDPLVNDFGQLAFVSSLGGTGVNRRNDSGIFRGGGNSELTLVVRKGDPAPGTAAGVNFGGQFTFGNPVLNGSGQTAFQGSLTGTDIDISNERGIFKEEVGGNLILVARAGDAAPGTADGVTFGGRAAFGGLALNGNGQTAFVGFLTGTEAGFGSKGIFAEDPNGILRLIARTGQLLDVSDDPLAPDFRTISSLNFMTGSGNEDGRRSGFNDRGQLAFLANFTNGTSGIFVSNRVAIPEPGTLALWVWSGLLVSRRRLPTLAA